MLFIVSTPIGNMEDITFRAIDALKGCDIILCEDTRRTMKILSHYGFEKRLESYNDVNKERKTPYAMDMLRAGKTVCIVSDSGTPGINDPGFNLVRECVKEGIPVSPIPGPSSIVSALVCSGLPTDSFTYLGFVPKKPGKRQEMLERIRDSKETVIVLETPHRIMKTLEAMDEVMPGKRIVIAREMTKKFEEFIRGTVREVLAACRKRSLKGEMVLVIGN